MNKKKIKQCLKKPQLRSSVPLHAKKAKTITANEKFIVPETMRLFAAIAEEKTLDSLGGSDS